MWDDFQIGVNLVTGALGSLGLFGTAVLGLLNYQQGRRTMHQLDKHGTSIETIKEQTNGLLAIARKEGHDDGVTEGKRTEKTRVARTKGKAP